MGIQNNINAMLGTAAAAATMGKHVSEQAKANDIKIAETEVKAAESAEEVRQAEKKLDEFNTKFSNDPINEKAVFEADAKIDPNMSDEEYFSLKNQTDLVNKALDIKSEDASHDVVEAFREKALYTGGSKKKINTLTKNLEMAEKAKQSVEGEIESHRQLKFDLELARKKQDAIKLMLEKGGKR